MCQTGLLRVGLALKRPGWLEDGQRPGFGLAVVIDQPDAVQSGTPQGYHVARHRRATRADLTQRHQLSGVEMLLAQDGAQLNRHQERGGDAVARAFVDEVPRIPERPQHARTARQNRGLEPDHQRDRVIERRGVRCLEGQISRLTAGGFAASIRPPIRK